MAVFRLTHRARQDLREINAYTRQAWGADQARNYHQSIRSALEKLSVSPKVGLIRKELGPEIRSFTMGNHVAYYVESEGGITVARILHPSMETEGRLGPKGNRPKDCGQ